MTTLCYKVGNDTQYALEGAVEIAGAAIKWAQDVDFILDNKERFRKRSKKNEC